MNLNKIKFYSPSFSWAFFILFICLLPQNKIPKQHFPHEDLLVHLTLYFILGILVLFAWFKTNTIITIRQLISTWAAISLFGFLLLFRVVSLTVKFGFENRCLLPCAQVRAVVLRCHWFFSGNNFECRIRG